MLTYKVEKRDGYYRVIGLANHNSTDTLLVYHMTSDESETPEVCDPSNAKRMHGALYDLFQWHDGLHDGDRFETPFGAFKCEGVHVVPEAA